MLTWLKSAIRPLVQEQQLKSSKFQDVYFEQVTYRDDQIKDFDYIVPLAINLIYNLKILADVLELVSPGGRTQPMLLMKHPVVARLLPEIID
jgi:hypothetical protein